MRENLVGQGMFESSWRIMMYLHGVGVGDCQPHLLRNLAWVCTPGPEIIGPGPLTVAGVLLDVVDGAGSAQDHCSHVFPPGMRWDPLNAEVDVELQVGVFSFPCLIPSVEVESPAPVDDALLTGDPLSAMLIREDDQILLWIMLDHLKVIEAKPELRFEGVADVVGFGVVVVPLKPAHRSLANERIPAPLDGSRSRDKHGLGRRPSSWVSGVGCHSSRQWITPCNL